MKLIIVESQTKAKTIFRLLKIRTIATFGHLLDLPRNNFGIYFDKEKKEFCGKYVFLKGKKKLIEKIKRTCQANDPIEKIYLATDPDREGEMIAYHLFQLLKDNVKNISRIIFHELTKRSLEKALSNETSINLNLVLAQQTRRFLDRILGYSLSPKLWQTFKIRNLSAGRVQTAVLYLVVKREREIRNFKTEKYFCLKVTISTQLGPRNLFFVKKKLTTEEKQILEEKMKNLKSVEFKSKKSFLEIIPPPLPLDTEMLQRIAFKKLKYPVAKTMFLAQKLFESGYITYHRTDSHFIEKNFSQKIGDFIKKNYGEEYFQMPRYRKGKLAFEAHESIRPTSLKIPKLSDDLLKLYKLIFFHTILAHMKPVKIKKDVLTFQANDLIFQAIVRSIVFDGFSRLTNLPIKTELWPEFSPGQKAEILKFNFEEKETKPPPRFTEGSLVKEMKILGIGRPSTYASTIEILKRRGYVVKSGVYLKPTQLGEDVIGYFEKEDTQIINLNLTKEIEEKLDLIAKGEPNYHLTLLQDFWSKYRRKDNE